jgi:hypothetical protein
MNRRLLWGASLVAGAAALGVFVARVGWDSRSARLRRELGAAAPRLHDAFSQADLAELPEPVVRFFRHVLRDGQPMIRAVDLTTAGEFQTGSDEKGWKPFTAVQRFSTQPPGFVWDATIRMAPLLPVYVRDAYVGGHAEMRGRVLALLPVVNEVNRPGLAAGQLHRYLGETMWFPTALLPWQGVAWQAIDTKSAVASITDRGITVSLRFLFTPDGDVAEIFAVDRLRAVDGRYEPTPWAVRCDDYQAWQGVRIPTRCEAEWRLPEGPLPYWRGRVVDVRYELTP